MENKDKLKKSEVNISRDVISSIVAIAINEIEGFKVVKRLVDRVTSKTQAIKVIFDENDNTAVTIEANVEVKYGTIIQEEVSVVQENIISNVEIMTGLKVKKVNLIIESLYIEEK